MMQLRVYRLKGIDLLNTLYFEEAHREFWYIHKSVLLFTQNSKLRNM